MNKPKSKKEALAQLEELKAYIDTMPDDVERDLTDITRGDKYVFLSHNNVISSIFNSDIIKTSSDDIFPQRLRTRSKEHLESMKKYRDATSRFMAKCHEVNLEDADSKPHEVYFDSSIKEWRCGLWAANFYNPLVIKVSKEGAKKLIEWCTQKYPNGLNWREL